MSTPNVEALLYLCPPTDGLILTPTHYDGHGTQASLHVVLFGGVSNYNLVYTFPGARQIHPLEGTLQRPQAIYGRADRKGSG